MLGLKLNHVSKWGPWCNGVSFFRSVLTVWTKSIGKRQFKMKWCLEKCQNLTDDSFKINYLDIDCIQIFVRKLIIEGPIDDKSRRYSGNDMTHNGQQSSTWANDDLISRRILVVLCYYPSMILWPSDGVWRPRTGSTLAHVMACCITAPSHHLTQYWFTVSKIQWHSFEGNGTRATPTINH